tara:strand:- start:1553 stop:2218 length:666 start_codon:yes stop_codon:yes gene_type:complete
MKTSVIKFKHKLKRIHNPIKLIKKLITNKNVLNIGCAGNVKYYLPNNKKEWHHYQFLQYANKLIGVDIDKESIEYANKYGFTIENQNIENMKLKTSFDIIILIDVIEHLNAPVIAIENLVNNHLKDDGLLIISTPNGSSFTNFIRAIFNMNLNVFYDHTQIYYPEHFQVICNRLGIKLKNILFFDFFAKGKLITKFKNLIFIIISIFFPRLSSSFLIIITK